MNTALPPVGSVDDLLRLGPLDRLEALIGGANFAPNLREEPITFDMHDPIYGFGCGIQGCLQHSTQAAWSISCQGGQGSDGLPVAGLSFLHGPGCRC